MGILTRLPHNLVEMSLLLRQRLLRQRFSRQRQIVLLLLALAAAGCMWFYVRCIVVPQQVVEGAQLGRPRGNLSDLYPRWLGARELLLHRRNPYSQEITREIQRGYYGRELDPSRPGDPTDQQGFAYPVYVVFLLAPTILMDFSSVQTWYIWLSIACTALSVLVWKRTLGVPLHSVQSLAVVALMLGSYSFIEGFSLQQPLLVVALILASSFLARVRGWYILSGVLLAIATIKPQIAMLPVILMIFWVAASWRDRKRWFWAFAATMLAFFAASEFLLPGWLFQFLQAVRAYSSYLGGTAFLDWLVGEQLASIARAGIILVVVWLFWNNRNAAADSITGRRMLSLSLVAGVCIAPNLATYNQVLLLPALLLLWDQWQVLGRSGIVGRSLRPILLLLLSWQWVACGILIVARVVFRAEHFVARAWQLPLDATLSLPAVMLLLLLFWPTARISEETFTSA